MAAAGSSSPGKNAARKNAEWAARAKKDGFPIRKDMRCPIGHSHMVSMSRFMDHLNNCPGPRRKNVQR